MGLFPKDRDLNRTPERVELPVRASDYRVRSAELVIRLDAFLARHLTWRSRSSIQRLIHQGFVAVDVSSPERPSGRGVFELETRPGRRLYDGSRVAVTVPEELRLNLDEGDASAVEVLYEDEYLVAVDKPPGVAVHPSGRYFADTMIQRVHARYGVPEGGILKLCHRLDRETSGLLLVARDREAHAAVMSLFEDRRVEKAYLALVRGVPDRDEGVIELALGPSRVSAVRMKMAVLADGMPARTDWRVLERGEDCALLECRPMTGRQHQIRVHLDAIGHPLVGDKMYSVPEDLFLRSTRDELTDADRALLGLERHALHNARLAFDHPVTGARVELECPLAPDMDAWFERNSRA